MHKLRQDDPGSVGNFSRTDRIISNTDGFFYRARGGKKFGPFSTRSIALFDLNSYLEVATLREQLSDEVFDVAV